MAPPILAGQSNQPNSHIGFRPFRPPTPPRTFGGRGFSGFAALGTPQGRAFARSRGITLPKPPKPPGAPKAPSAPAPSPLDSGYFLQVGANNAKTGDQIAGILKSDQLEQTQLQSALAQLAYQQPRDSLALEQRANARGGLYSSVYNQQLGDLNYKYAGRSGALVNNYVTQHADNLTGITSAYDQNQIDNANAYLSATERASKLAASNPAASAPAASKKGGGKKGGLNGRGSPKPNGNRAVKPPQLAGGSNQPNSHHGGGRAHGRGRTSGSGITSGGG